MESFLTRSVITWFPAALAKDKAKLQQVVRSAERVIGVPSPSLKSLHDTRALRRAKEIMADLAPRSRPLYPASFWVKVAAA